MLTQEREKNPSLLSKRAYEKKQGCQPPGNSWKILENHINPGKSWKTLELRGKTLNCPGKSWNLNDLIVKNIFFISFTIQLLILCDHSHFPSG